MSVWVFVQVRAVLYIATLTTGIMEAVTNVDHAVAAALSTRHRPTASTRSTRQLRVQAAKLMPVREALKNLHESDDCRWQGELCCAVLCCAVLCCAVLCCAVLCCAVLCCAVLGWAGLGWAGLGWAWLGWDMLLRVPPEKPKTQRVRDSRPVSGLTLCQLDAKHNHTFMHFMHFMHFIHFYISDACFDVHSSTCSQALAKP